MATPTWHSDLPPGTEEMWDIVAKAMTETDMLLDEATAITEQIFARAAEKLAQGLVVDLVCHGVAVFRLRPDGSVEHLERKDVFK